MLNKKMILTAGLLIATAVVFTANSYSSAKETDSKKQVEVIQTNEISNAEKLALIDKYQKQYYEIVKRNDYNIEKFNFDEVDKGKKEIDELFSEVENQITNTKYLKKHHQIEKRYAVCNAETTVGIKAFANRHYEAVDKLLNKVYKEVKNKISTEDFKKLEVSENEWIKALEEYNKAFAAKDYGTIGGVIYYEYQIDTRNFRTLLLMLYL